MSAPSPWQPRYALTTRIVNGLMRIQSAKTAVEHTMIPTLAASELRRRARIRSTHFSTWIEGNRLTLAEAEQVIESGRTAFPGRERDVAEVNNYWKALLQLEKWADAGRTFNEDLIRRLHSLVMNGVQSRPTPYRVGQNAVRDSSTGALVYLPPEAKDVPGLMKAMVKWANTAARHDIPVPVIAGLVHYQFVTIHPYYDGNGRTARLLATFLLYRNGYGLDGFLSLEEHHARDLASYYYALQTHPHHNYYEGRAGADLTPWLEYFIETLERVFVIAGEEARRWAEQGVPVEPDEIRKLDARARIVLSLFTKSDSITANDAAQALGISPRMARVLVKGWTDDGWLVVLDASRRARRYGLSAIYRQHLFSFTAMK